MPIKHIVFFRVPKDGSVTADEVAARLRTMDGNVPMLRGIEVGVDFNGSERAWDVALYTTFDSREDLAAYATYPFHAEIVAWIKDNNIVTCVVDYA